MWCPGIHKPDTPKGQVILLLLKTSFYKDRIAFVEFSDPTAVSAALLLDNTMLQGRNVKVSALAENVESSQSGRSRHRRAHSPEFPLSREQLLREEENQEMPLPSRNPWNPNTLTFPLRATVDAAIVARLFADHPTAVCVPDANDQAKKAQEHRAYVRDRVCKWHVTFADTDAAERCLQQQAVWQWLAAACLTSRPRHESTIMHILGRFSELDLIIPVLDWKARDGSFSMVGGTLLHAALLSNNTELTHALLVKGVSIDKHVDNVMVSHYTAHEYRHVYALHLAAIYSPSALGHLLAFGCDANMRAEYIQIDQDWNYTISLEGGTVLDLGMCGMARVDESELLQKGANPNNVFTHRHCSNGSGSVVIVEGCALHAAAWYERSPDLLLALIKAGADVTEACTEFFAEDIHYGVARPTAVTPLHILACSVKGSSFCPCVDQVSECLQLLLQHGGVLEAEDGQGRTPADWAAMCGNDTITSLFVASTNVQLVSTVELHSFLSSVT